MTHSHYGPVPVEEPWSTQRGREAIRAKIREDAMLRAETVSRSLKCAARGEDYKGRRHAKEPGGCNNTGRTCICPCHDPE